MAFLKASNADVKTTMVFLRGAALIPASPDHTVAGHHWVVGGALLVDIGDTPWPVSPVYEIGASVGGGFYWSWPGSGWRLQITSDALLPGDNISAIIAVSAGRSF